MSSLTKRLRLRSIVKESFDNLPSGICFFSENGLVVMCNHQMSRLIFEMTGQDLQSLDELQNLLNTHKSVNGAIRDGYCFILQNGNAWSFSMRQITDRDGKHYTEVIASDVSELQKKQKLLTEANEAKKQTIAALEQIQQNVVSITREEEILSMKMKLHHEFGYNLQTIRRFVQNGCPSDEKESFLTIQKDMLRKMQGELGNNDEIDPLTELSRLASALDTEIVFTGDLPSRTKIRVLLAYVVRECLTNTISHAQGDRVFVSLSYDSDTLTAQITNTGKRPKTEITEGGGLTSLRRRIENAGGTMTVRGLPRFMLSVTIPYKEEDDL